MPATPHRTQGRASTLDPEVETHDFDIPDAGSTTGTRASFAWLTGWSEGWESWRIEDLEFRPAGDDQVLAPFRTSAGSPARG